MDITVTDVNDGPVAVDDTHSTNEETALTINVIANDTDQDGDTLSVSGVGTGDDAPSNGTAAQTGVSTTVSYTPNANYNGTDTFTYTVSDGNGGTAIGTVTVTVTAVNDAPTFDAGDGPATRNVAENTASGADLGDVFGASDVDDGADALTYSLEGTDGASFEVDSSTGQLKTKAELDYETKTTYQVEIRMTDSGGGAGSAEALSGTITVDITVTDVNDGPVAVDDTHSTNEETALTINVIANDTDQDGDTLSVSGVGTGDDAPSNGTAAQTGVGTTGVSYTPNANYNGTDTFTYTVSDGNGGTAIGTVTVTVTAVNDAPTFDAGDGPATRNVAENTASGADLGDVFGASDVDDGADALTYSLEGTDGASFEVDSSTGQLKTKAELDYETKTTYQVEIRMTDSGGGAGSAEALSDTITVDITVTDVNDGPVAVDDTHSTNEETALTINVIANDTDQDGDTLSVSGVGTGDDAPSNGTAAQTVSARRVSATPPTPTTTAQTPSRTR